MIPLSTTLYHVSLFINGFTFFSDVDELRASADMQVKMDQAYAILMMFSNKSLGISQNEFYKIFGQVP